ncbi:alpha/beta hydrolase [Aliiruegeria lutimaris]|uniref:Acetyl esterase/lipase n=1 Tax=Aliiruegeria lutimaris TaxID=571298 RepID=A0A1G9NDK5_9RHOB|nr:alpha/beta hydrolase [Aliiruegeria lutimaris]SDL84540.1 Acetyl esterase/lipase [Aliiruegeria lutimaris]
MQKEMISSLLALSVSAGVAEADEPGYSVENNIRFGVHSEHLLDVFSPSTVSDDTPVLVFLFGGGFTRGSTAQVLFVGESFAEAGVITVTPNYRIKTAFPTFIEDAAKAVGYVRANFKTSIGEPRPIVIGGWSAGAYIAGMVSYDERYLEAEGVPRDAISGFIGLAGRYLGGLCNGGQCPTVFTPETEGDWPIAQFVDAADPPMLLVHGTKDVFVEIGSMETLAAAGKSAGLDVTILIAEDRTHTQVRFDMEAPGTPVRAATDAFIARVTSD